MLKGCATRNDIGDDFVTMRALDAIFAMLKSIVDDFILDDIVTCGIALRHAKLSSVSPQILHLLHLLLLQPIENYNEFRLIYFISFLLLVGFFVLNMFVGVVVENFHKCRESQEAEEKVKRAEKRAKKMDKKRRSMLEGYYDDDERVAVESTEGEADGWYRVPTESGWLCMLARVLFPSACFASG